MPRLLTSKQFYLFLGLFAAVILQAVVVAEFFPAGPVRRTGIHSVEVNAYIEHSRFYPHEIRVRKGDTVTIQITNKDSFVHGFAIAELRISNYLPAEGHTEVTFTADTKGEVVFFCNVWCSALHPKMNGRIIVE